MTCSIVNTPKKEDISIANNGIKEVRDIIISDQYDVVILDEANIAIFYNLFSLEELIDVLMQKPESMEIIITGRYAMPELIEVADLATEMNEVKHYYKKGVQARLGIEY